MDNLVQTSCFYIYLYIFQDLCYMLVGFADFLKKNYKRAMSNIGKLESRECIVMHGIDATKVASHHLLGGMTFDRIIFNFPFAGFFNDLSREAQLRSVCFIILSVNDFYLRHVFCLSTESTENL